MIDFKIKKENGKDFIFDILRKKYVRLTPEEWVRQNFIKYLIEKKKFPSGLISVEMSVNINNQNQRSDIVVFNKQAKPIMIIECKAPNVKITQKTMEQAARYNWNLKVEYLVVTNGKSHFICKINHSENNYEFLPEIPNYTSIVSKI